MSSMTMPLWRVLELTGDPGTGITIGLDSYPIFDDKERVNINRLIIDHFWNRDIGQETIAMFTFMMRRTMREIMPMYNQLYQSQYLLAGRELTTYDLTTIRDGVASEKGANESNSTTTADARSGSRSVFFDTPQTALARNKDYAANATDAESTSENTGGSTGTASTSTDATTRDTSRTTGFQGSAADLLSRYRATIINTDLMLLNEPELTSMFLGVWENSADQIQPPRHRHLGIL